MELRAMLIAFAVLTACHQAPTPSASETPSEPPAPAPATSGSARTIAQVTPEIAAKAAEILHEHPGAEYGTEFPFEIDGRKYVARVEVHDNPDGDPNRPQGQHKGITVYSAD